MTESESEQRDLKSEFELCGLMRADRKGNIMRVLWITQANSSIRTKCHWKLVFLEKESEIQLINSETYEASVSLTSCGC